MKPADCAREKPVLETRRLVLRPLCREDIPALKEWLGDPAIYRYWGKGPSKSDLEPERLFLKPTRPVKSFRWGLVHLEAGKVVGELWVYRIENNRTAKVAFRLSPAFQGKGLMAEALSRAVAFCFGETGLRRLWTDVHVDNAASFKTLEKAGFRREGFVRGGKMVNVVCDYYLYGLTKDSHGISAHRLPAGAKAGGNTKNP